MMRNTLDALFGQLVFGNVGGHGKTAQHLSLLSDMRQQPDLDVARFAIWEPAHSLVSDRVSLQHLHKIAFDLAVDLLPDDLAQVLAQEVGLAMTEKLRIALIDEL